MLLLLTATFIGNQACIGCHGAIAASYMETPMARSSGRVEPLSPVSFVAAGNRYRIEDRKLIFAGGSQTMDYFVGSNSAGRSYLSEHDGFLFESPVTWYAQKQVWDASPGYELDTSIRLNRPVEPSCLLCHASRVRPVRGTLNRYGTPPFLDNGVSCERCHGPGSEHVRDPLEAKMVNPARLDPELRDSVCSQCHLTGEARVELPGRNMAAFQAGERLSDYATYLVRDTDGRDMKVTSHAEKLAASLCKRNSGDAPWCGSCHDVHDQKNDFTRTQAACTGCHSSGQGFSGHYSKDNCAGCHMPKSRLSDDGGHGVLTDHSIPRGPRSGSQPGTRDLKVFLGVVSDRAFGIAYAQTGDARAREFLMRAAPVDAEVLLRLAALEKDERRAAVLYEAVLKVNPVQPVALVNLGAVYARAGRVVEAGKLWERALAVNPGIEEAVLNLAAIRPAAAARSILASYLELNPASRAAQTRLSELY